LDNAEAPTEVAEFWPTSDGGAILLTTQDTSWLSQEYITRTIVLDCLSTKEGTDLVKELFQRRRQDISQDDAKKIVKETAGLPLAIRHVSSYILAEGMPAKVFLEDYASHQTSRGVDAWGHSTTPWYSHTLATFLDAAFAKMTPRAIAILAQLCFLDVDNIPEILITETEPPPNQEGNLPAFLEHTE
jgi:hypothetical protein